MIFAHHRKNLGEVKLLALFMISKENPYMTASGDINQISKRKIILIIEIPIVGRIDFKHHTHSSMGYNVHQGPRFCVLGKHANLGLLVNLWFHG